MNCAVTETEPMSMQKQEVLAWACKRSINEINERINKEISCTLDKTLSTEARDSAKFWAVELVTVLNRRNAYIAHRAK